MNTDLITQFIDSIPTDELEKILSDRKNKIERKPKKITRKEAFILEIQKEAKRKMFYHGK